MSESTPPASIARTLRGVRILILLSASTLFFESNWTSRLWMASMLAAAFSWTFSREADTELRRKVRAPQVIAGAVIGGALLLILLRMARPD